MSRRLLQPVPVRPTECPSLDAAEHLDLGLAGDVLLADLAFGQHAAGAHRALRDIWSPFVGCSLVIANFEGPITEQSVPSVVKPYNLKNSHRALGLFDRRFVLTLANNHIMDYGPRGLLDTIEALESANVAFAGAGGSLERACRPRYVTVDGVTVAIISAADPRFQAASSTSPGTCPASAGRLVELVTDARRSAALVVVAIHMGLEHTHLPSPRQVRLADACLEAGAQVVQYHHSHRLSGCAGDTRGVVLFGTGNYAFPITGKFRSQDSRRTAAWRARYSKQRGRIVAVVAVPARIDAAGIPCRVDARLAERELLRIERYGRRMSSAGRPFWRLRELLSPDFVVPTVANYGAVLKRNGWSAVWGSVTGGLKAHFDR